MKKLFSRILKRSLDEYTDFIELLRYEQTNRVLAKTYTIGDRRLCTDTGLDVVRRWYMHYSGRVSIHYSCHDQWMSTDHDLYLDGKWKHSLSFGRALATRRCRSDFTKRRKSTHARARHAHRSPVTITHYSRIVAFVWSTIRWRDNQPIVALIGVDVWIV